MKRIAIFLTIVILIVASVAYMFINYQIKNANLKKLNEPYVNIYNKEINGSEVATLINRAIDNNKKNNVEKNEEGIYINNGENSINIEFSMLDDPFKVYNMETFYKNDVMEFAHYYSDVLFKCTNIQYHQKTGRVSYLYIEQITE